MKYVTISKAAEQSGYSEKAIRRKIEDGVWTQNRQWRKAPDGRILIDLQGVETWAEGQLEPSNRSGRRSASSSRSAGAAA
ncbi:excisionase [Phenylobacterium sp.]|uniref:excisionase n=1 Tax=Phenylobacterium sp. TaxID=1871053 RepID=UPI00391D0608